MTRSSARLRASPQPTADPPTRTSARGRSNRMDPPAEVPEKKEAPVTSDTENSERPVREQLKKASISMAARKTSDPTGPEVSGGEELEQVEENGGEGETTRPRGRLQKKRSHEDMEEDQPDKETSQHHTRKRSRDGTAEEDELNNGQRKSFEKTRGSGDEVQIDISEGEEKNKPPPRAATPETSDKQSKKGRAAETDVASPKSKRSRLHSASAETDVDLNHAPDQPGKKHQLDSDLISKDPATESTLPPTGDVPPTSGSGSAPAPSPFASLAGNKSSTNGPQNPSSAFQSSSAFGSLSGAASGFGSGGKTSGGFGSGGTFGSGGSFATGSNSPLKSSDDKEPSEPGPISPFGGGVAQPSPFASATTGSAFGSGLSKSSAFGGTGFSSLGGGSGLTSFASGKPPAPSSSKPAKPFGAPPDDDDEDDDADTADDKTGSGVKSPLSPHAGGGLADDADKQDERFFAQSLETGEEGEVTAFSCRAKLYNFAVVGEGKKEWKERGLGVIRLNVRGGAAAAVEESAAKDEPKKTGIALHPSDEEAKDCGADGSSAKDLEAGTKTKDASPPPNEDESKPAKEETKFAEEEPKSKPQARLLMRADGSHRVILNTPVKKEVQFGAPGGGPPTSSYIYFYGAFESAEEGGATTEGAKGVGGLELLQLKVRAEMAKQLYEQVVQLQEAM